MMEFDLYSVFFSQALRQMLCQEYGAMLSAGMGHISYDEVPRAMSEAAALVIGRSN